MTDLTREDLARMTPDQIVAAQQAGQLDHLLGIPPVPARKKAAGTDPLTIEDVRELYRAGDYDTIIAAHEAGRISKENA